jgi:hypothetical protein
VVASKTKQNPVRPYRKAGSAMPIDPTDLARSIGALGHAAQAKARERGS